jgi:clan AA aspartic protease (TIGR02281 family)
MRMKRFQTNLQLVFLWIMLLYPTLGLAEEISLKKRGGVYQLRVEINGVLTLNFILDTGATDVNIPADVALTLYRTGTIRDSDFLTGQTYVLADGSRLRSSRFLLQSLKIGNRRIASVPASIGPVASPLLLGQSFLERLGTWGTGFSVRFSRPA